MSGAPHGDNGDAAGESLPYGRGWHLPNGRDAMAWLLARAFRMLLAVVVIVANAVEWSLIPPVFVETQVLSVALMVLTALTPFWPRAASWGIIALIVARTFVLDLSGPSPLWGMWIALVLIGHDCALGWAVLACGIVTVSQCVPAFMDSYTALSAIGVEMVNYVGSFVLATLIGVSFRWRAQRDASERRAMALERRQWELDELKRNTELASRIHDTASGGLSYIALTAQRRLRQLPDDAADDDGADGADGTNDPYGPYDAQDASEALGSIVRDERRDWRFVNDQALAVLDEVHKVIDLLRADAADTSDTVRLAGTASGTDMRPEADSKARFGLRSDGQLGESHDGKGGLAEALRRSRMRLERLGFAGDASLNGALPADADPMAVRAAERLLGEITANITRHMTPGGGAYHIVVTLGKHSIEIMGTNPIAERTTQTDDAETMEVTETTRGASHGAGLRLHRELIETLGGELNATGEDGEWVVYARIPVRGDGKRLDVASSEDMMSSQG